MCGKLWRKHIIPTTWAAVWQHVKQWAAKRVDETCLAAAEWSRLCRLSLVSVVRRETSTCTCTSEEFLSKANAGWIFLCAAQGMILYRPLAWSTNLRTCWRARLRQSCFVLQSTNIFRMCERFLQDIILNRLKIAFLCPCRPALLSVHLVSQQAPRQVQVAASERGEGRGGKMEESTRPCICCKIL